MKKSGVEGVKGDDDVGKAMTMNCVEIGSKGSSSIKHGWWTSVPACAVTHHHHIPTTAKGQQAMRNCKKYVALLTTRCSTKIIRSKSAQIFLMMGPVSWFIAFRLELVNA
ncbi:hypothetical protein Mgra_00006594 [Meloidogyne graminicola]|uniref:Uncharacterized protein n=1 Tax=Meloidogyne graminicola TaxID=189291 RepID=A0A8S9ZL98_9BILA|nr:hypothetical protein Mgra_00006594 [Meloidogyne graminicola]